MTQARPKQRRGELRIAAFALWLCLAGCSWRQPTNPFGPGISCPLSPTASKEELVAYLNQNISKVSSWRATNAKIALRGAPDLDATIAVEAGRKFRLVATSLRGAEVDLGSNPELFWVWARENKPPAVYFAAHDQLSVAQRKMPIPFQTDWLLEALGVTPLDPINMTSLRLQDARGQPVVQLVSEDVSPQGQPVQKLLIVDGCHGRILEHRLSLTNGMWLARARFSDHRIDPTTGAMLPHRIDLDWPQARMSLTLFLRDIEVNRRFAEQTWAMPTFPGYDTVNLGQ